MRVWDIPPCFLNRGSLLGEHREIHGIYNILTLGKKGYSRHPETLRWNGHLSALARRHDMVVNEMKLRGYNHHSPLPEQTMRPKWPQDFIDAPHKQYEILRNKYLTKEPGPITIPSDSRALWRTHKFSLLARDERLYRETGPRVASMRQGVDRELAEALALALREPPSLGGIENALDHMWGFLKKEVSDEAKIAALAAKKRSPATFLSQIRLWATRQNIDYLLQSTALYELAFFLSGDADNCPFIANPDQRDMDNDGRGSA